MYILLITVPVTLVYVAHGHDLSASMYMALSEALVKKLSSKFPAGDMSNLSFRGNNMTIKADEQGNAVLLFIGKRMEDGHIKGERYARRLVIDKEGNTIKDHWELKGRST